MGEQDGGDDERHPPHDSGKYKLGERVEQGGPAWRKERHRQVE